MTDPRSNSPLNRILLPAAIVALAVPGAGARAGARAGGGVLFFVDTPDAFLAAVDADGSSLHRIEDFEDGNVPPNTGIGMNDPLDSDSNNAVFQPGEIVAGLRLQSNDNGTPAINDPGTSGPNPVGSSALVALGVGANGATDKCVAPTAFGFSRNSIDVIAIAPTVRAVSLRLADLFPTLDNLLEIRVYDRDELLLGSIEVDGDGPIGARLGIVLSEPDARIGRINVWGVGPTVDFGGEEAIYEAGLYGVCPLDLDASGDIGFGDLLEVLARWNQPVEGPPDFDGNGVVGFGDLLSVLSAWGACP